MNDLQDGKIHKTKKNPSTTEIHCLQQNKMSCKERGKGSKERGKQ